jgi:RNA polymerase sigma factor (sigma-70 family)
MTELAEIEDFDELAKIIRKRVFYQYRSASNLDDLIQEAVIDAWKMFMDEKSTAYIIFWAVRRAARFLGEKPTPYTGNAAEHGGPRQTFTTAHGDLQREKIKRAQNDYYDMYGKYPSQAEIARQTGLHVRAVSKYVSRSNFHAGATSEIPPTISHLEAWGDESEGGTKGADYFRAIQEESFEERAVNTMLVRDVVTELKDREREIVYLHYWRDLTQADIARELKISPAYTHRVHKMAIERLRDILAVKV